MELTLSALDIITLLAVSFSLICFMFFLCVVLYVFFFFLFLEVFYVMCYFVTMWSCSNVGIGLWQFQLQGLEF
jgi:hypothetical protein